jgi:hypothetical protein
MTSVWAAVVVKAIALARVERVPNFSLSQHAGSTAISYHLAGSAH